MTARPSLDKRCGAALCCQCGNPPTNPSTGLRTARSDPNRTAAVDEDARGWRMTRTLGCPVCERPTVHAMLCGGHPDLRDRAGEFLYKRASWMQG
jgi:hypothetical protein